MDDLFELSPTEYWVRSYLLRLAREQGKIRVELPLDDERPPLSRKHILKVLKTLLDKGAVEDVAFSRSRHQPTEITLFLPAHPCAGKRLNGDSPAHPCAGAEFSTTSPAHPCAGADVFDSLPAHTRAGKIPASLAPVIARMTEKIMENQGGRAEETGSKAEMNGNSPARQCAGNEQLKLICLKELISCRSQWDLKQEIIAIDEAQKKKLIEEAIRGLGKPSLMKVTNSPSTLLYALVRLLQTPEVKNGARFVKAIVQKEPLADTVTYSEAGGSYAHHRS